MNVLSIENISITLNDEPLFSNVTFGLEEKEHIGLIGKNGTGKSTLLKILDGKLTPDTGKVSMANSAEIMMLNQIVEFDKDDTVYDYMHKGEGTRFEQLRQYYKLLEDAINNEDKIAKLTEQLDKDNTWNIESDFLSILGELGLENLQDRKMSTLSGGQRKKVSIARVLCANPSILLLDEPTNHLDIETIEWLQKYLANSQMTIIVVTHDRYFLNSVCTKILELEGSNIYIHPGNYNEYIERKATRLEAMQKEQDRLSTILRRELQWLQRGCKARTGKDNNRKARIEQMQSEQKSVAEVNQNKFTSNSRRLGKKILDVKHIAKGYSDKFLFQDFTFSFTKGMKIGIIGSNGSGKSTLLDVLTSHIPCDQGTIDTGINTVFGYYDQMGRNLNSNKTVLEYIEDIAQRIVIAPGQELSASQFLETFSFPVKLHRLPISTLSGGQRRRLYLISRLVKNPNFLVLDEPTNDLDVDTMENLEQYVEDFEGCSIVVSHDRAFLDHTCDQLFIIEDSTIKMFSGNYTDYKNEVESISVEEKKKTQTKQQYRQPSKKKGLTFKEKKEYEELTIKVDEIGELITKLEESFADINPTELGTLDERNRMYQEQKLLLEEVEERWLELAEKAEE